MCVWGGLSGGGEPDTAGGVGSAGGEWGVCVGGGGVWGGVLLVVMVGVGWRGHLYWVS